jgi:hypothetical protein
MWLWNRVIKPALEWTGHYESIQSLLHTEVYTRTIGPLLSGGTVAVLGYSEGLPWMWIAMASSVVVMAVTTTRIRMAEWAERNNPKHKLIVTGAHFAAELLPVDVPEKTIENVGNRSARRSGKAARHVIPAHTLSEGQLQADIPRELNSGQILIEAKNNAPFPISVALVSAETEAGGKRPPRTSFPKPPSTIPPGETARIPDAAIQMDGYPCGRIAGKLNMLLKYGRPGRETLEMRLIADLDIVMENFGLVSAVIAGWKNV